MSIEQKLYPIEIEKIKEIGRGQNFCLNMAFKPEKYGLLTGPYSRSYFLMHSPSHYINIGGASTYVFCKDYKTKYVNELKEGDELLTMDSNGNESSNIVKKIKTSYKPMLNIKGEHKISGNDIFELLALNNEDYFHIYSRIFHLKEKRDWKSIDILALDKYKNKKKCICACLDVGTVVLDSEEVYMACNSKLMNVKQIKIGDKILAYIQMPGLFSRHLGMNYGGERGYKKGFCVEV
jgi:3-dehydroquinate synthase class II